MTPASDVRPDNATLQGVGQRMLAELKANDTLPELPAVASEALTHLVEQLQPQIGPLGADERVRSWINAAAIIEAHGFHDLAVDLIEGLRRLVVRGRDDDEGRAFDAFLWTRRGRIARLAAQLDDAEECYREALRRTPRSRTALWWADVVSNAWIGLSVLAAGRGNYPVAQQEARKLLIPQIPPTQQVQGHLLLGLILRKRGKPGAALAHVWRAFDLLDSADPRRADVLVTLAEIAAEVGEWEGALHAQLAALALPILPRVAAAALSGVLNVLAHPGARKSRAAETIIARSAWAQRTLTHPRERTTVERLEDHAKASLRDSHVGHATLTAHDKASLALSLAELIAADGRYNEASEWLTFVETLSVSHGFNERHFQIAALRKAWSDQAGSSGQSRSKDLAPARSRRRAIIWQRLDKLEALSVGSEGLGR